MAKHTIPQMNKKLEELSSFFSEQTTVFTSAISKHEGQFTREDYTQFEKLVDQIKTDAFHSISRFFESLHEARSSSYESQITLYTEATTQVQTNLHQFRKELEDSTIHLKEEQNQKELLLDHFSQKYSQNVIFKKCWKILNNYRKQRQVARIKDQAMDQIYQKNLLKKAFFPWRTLTYKEGYEGTVRRETEKDIMSIHEQYQSIVDILKAKITQTDDIIKVKRAAKGEFAYALSKNLLKSISNLSLEMSLRDGECDESETRKFMVEVDHVIKEKLERIKDYKHGLVAGNEEEGKKKKITFA